MIVRGMKLMVGQNGTHWLAMPALPAVDKDGQPVRRGNKQVWNNTLEFADRSTRERFQSGILAALRKSHPEAFDA